MYIFNGILFSHKREGNWVTCSDVDEPSVHHEEWKQKNKYHILTHKTGIEKSGTDESTCWAGTETQTENECVHTAREGGWSELAEQHWHGHTATCKTESSGSPAHGSLVTWWAESGVRGRPQRKETCVLTADSSDVQKKWTQHWKAVTLQLKINVKNVLSIYNGIIIIKMKETGSFVGIWIDLVLPYRVNKSERKISYVNTYMLTLQATSQINLFSGQKECRRYREWTGGHKGRRRGCAALTHTHHASRREPVGSASVLRGAHLGALWRSTGVGSWGRLKKEGMRVRYSWFTQPYRRH